MIKEFNLSEKIFELSNLKLTAKDKLYENYDLESGGAKFLNPKNVKEFIRLLKEKLDNASIGYFGKVPIHQVKNEIDKLAGDKLSGGL